MSFPLELLAYGLNEKLLMEAFSQVENAEDEKSLSWYIRGIPDYGFYQDLHEFLKKCPHTRHFTKVSIGNFYNAIDKNLRDRSFQPINAYRFVDRLSVQVTLVSLL